MKEFASFDFLYKMTSCKMPLASTSTNPGLPYYVNNNGLPDPVNVDLLSDDITWPNVSFKQMCWNESARKQQFIYIFTKCFLKEICHFLISDVCRRQILTSNDGPRAERVKERRFQSTIIDLQDVAWILSYWSQGGVQLIIKWRRVRT